MPMMKSKKMVAFDSKNGMTGIKYKKRMMSGSRGMRGKKKMMMMGRGR